MFRVIVENECGCFKKSDYQNNAQFKTQQEAYQYAHVVAELMNDECCGKHEFYAQPGAGDTFVIKSPLNITFVSGHTAGKSCDIGCDSTDEWQLEQTK